jgi:DNA-nicking Smr family endonuclease
MKGRKPRGLSGEDLEVWRQVISRVERTKPIISVKPVVKVKKVPDALPRTPMLRPFKVGERVAEKQFKQPPAFHNAPQRTSPNMDRKNFQRLVKGQLEIDGTLDLHGMTADQAKVRLLSYVGQSHAMGCRLILVITGKGKHKGSDEFNRPVNGVLRQSLPEWLRGPTLANKILQVSQAQPKHGGAGAYYVYLRRTRA